MTKSEVQDLITLFESNADNNMLTMDIIKLILESKIDPTTTDLINKLFDTTSIKGIVLYADSYADSDGMFFGPCGLSASFFFEGKKYNIDHDAECISLYDENDDYIEIDFEDTNMSEDLIESISAIIQSHYDDLNDGFFDRDSFEIHYGETTGFLRKFKLIN